MKATDQLIAVARVYAAGAEVEQSVVSWRVFGDSKKLGAIINGADIQTRRFEAAMDWFRANWPEGTAWPKGVSRPFLGEAAA